MELFHVPLTAVFCSKESVKTIGCCFPHEIFKLLPTSFEELLNLTEPEQLGLESLLGPLWLDKLLPRLDGCLEVESNKKLNMPFDWQQIIKDLRKKPRPFSVSDQTREKMLSESKKLKEFHKNDVTSAIFAQSLIKKIFPGLLWIDMGFLKCDKMITARQKILALTNISPFVQCVSTQEFGEFNPQSDIIMKKGNHQINMNLFSEISMTVEEKTSVTEDVSIEVKSILYVVFMKWVASNNFVIENMFPQLPIELFHKAMLDPRIEIDSPIFPFKKEDNLKAIKLYNDFIWKNMQKTIKDTDLLKMKVEMILLQYQAPIGHKIMSKEHGLVKLFNSLIKSCDYVQFERKQNLKMEKNVIGEKIPKTLVMEQLAYIPSKNENEVILAHIDKHSYVIILCVSENGHINAIIRGHNSFDDFESAIFALKGTLDKICGDFMPHGLYDKKNITSQNLKYEFNEIVMSSKFTKIKKAIFSMPTSLSINMTKHNKNIALWFLNLHIDYYNNQQKNKFELWHSGQKADKQKINDFIKFAKISVELEYIKIAFDVKRLTSNQNTFVMHFLVYLCDYIKEIINKLEESEQKKKKEKKEDNDDEDGIKKNQNDLVTLKDLTQLSRNSKHLAKVDPKQFASFFHKNLGTFSQHCQHPHQPIYIDEKTYNNSTQEVKDLTNIITNLTDGTPLRLVCKKEMPYLVPIVTAGMPSIEENGKLYILCFMCCRKQKPKNKFRIYKEEVCKKTGRFPLDMLDQNPRNKNIIKITKAKYDNRIMHFDH